MLSVDHQVRLRQPGSSSAITWAPDGAGPCLTLILFRYLSDFVWISS